MPIAGRTREQLRVGIGYNLGAIYVSDASAVGTTTTFIDNTLRGGDDAHNGKWLLITSGALDGVLTRVDDYTQSSTTLVVAPAFASAPASGVTYELWEAKYSPDMIHEHINNAILDATGRVYDPEESLALHGDGNIARFDIPSQFAILNNVEYRHKVPSRDLHTFEAVFTETTNANVTQTADAEDRKQGTNSLKLVYAAAAGANTLITHAIASLNISKYTHIEFWIKSSVATAAADLHVLLDDTAGAGSPLETLAVPALTADTWTFVRVALANPRLDTAIISIGLRYTTDLGAATIWWDHMKVVDDNSGVWTRLDKNSWSVDKSTRDLVLTSYGRQTVGYRLMKLVGGDNPLILTSDAAVNEIDDYYVICKATALALTSVSRGAGTDPDNTRPLAAMWEARAAYAASAFPFVTNGRAVG